MKYNIYIFLGVLIGLLVIMGISVSAVDMYVDDDADPEWYDSTHVESITEGIISVTSGCTVFIYNGTYSVNDLHVTLPMNIIGESKDNVILDDLTALEYIFYVDSNNVNISNLTMLGNTLEGKEVCNFKNSNSSTISHCEIYAVHTGIYAYQSNLFTVSDCNIECDEFDGEYAIHIKNNTNASIKNCTVFEGHYGVYIENSDNAVIEYYDTNMSYYGVYIKNSENALIENCDTNMDYYGLYVDNSGNVTIKNCTIINTSEIGITYLDNSPYGKIDNCTVYGMSFSVNAFIIVSNCDVFYEKVYISNSDYSTFTNVNIYNSNFGFMLNNAEHITISSCTVQDALTTPLLVEGSNYLTVEDSIFDGVGSSSNKIINSDYCNFTNIALYDNLYGFKLINAKYTSFELCSIQTTTYPVDITGDSHHLSIKNSTFDGTGTTDSYGIYIWNTPSFNHGIFENLQFNDITFSIMSYSISLNNLYNNITIYNSSYPFYVSSCSDTTFSNLTLYDSTLGFYYTSCDNIDVKDSTIYNVIYALYDAGINNHINISNILIYNSSYGVCNKKIVSNTSNYIYKNCIIKNNIYGIYALEYEGIMTWGETNLVYNNDIDYYINDSVDFDLYSNYLFDSNIENSVSDSIPYVNYNHISGFGLKEFNTAKMTSYCSGGKSAKITILNNDLSKWLVNQSSGSIYQKLGGFAIGTKYTIEIDNKFLFNHIAKSETLLESLTGVVQVDYSGTWSKHLFTISEFKPYKEDFAERHGFDGVDLLCMFLMLGVLALFMHTALYSKLTVETIVYMIIVIIIVTAMLGVIISL